jgi:Amt family ammonium transporter
VLAQRLADGTAASAPVASKMCAVAGLAAITPASGYVQPCAAIIIGAAAGLLCYGAVHLKDVFHYDDSARYGRHPHGRRRDRGGAHRRVR